MVKRGKAKSSGTLDSLIDEQLRPLYEKYYLDAPRSARIIIEHCGIAGASGLVPIPYADIAILLPNQIAMYGRLNDVLNISLSANTLHILGKFMLSQMAGMIARLPLMFFSKILGGILKLIPFAGTIGGAALDAASNAAVTYVLGVVYLKALVITTRDGKCDVVELQKALQEEFSNRDGIRNLYRAARERTSSMDFEKFKGTVADYEDGDSKDVSDKGRLPEYGQKGHDVEDGTQEVAEAHETACDTEATTGSDDETVGQPPVWPLEWGFDSTVPGEFRSFVTESLAELNPASFKIGDKWALDVVDFIDELNAAENDSERIVAGSIAMEIKRFLAWHGYEMLDSDTWNPDIQRAVAVEKSGDATTTILEKGASGLSREGKLIRKQEVIIQKGR